MENEKNVYDEDALREARRQILEQNRERGRQAEWLVEEKILKHVDNYEREVVHGNRRIDFEIRSKDGELIAVGEIKSGEIKDPQQIKDQIDLAEQSKTKTYILAHTDPEKVLEFLEKHPDVLEYAMAKGVNFMIKDLSVFERLQESIREEKDGKKDEKLEDYVGIITEKKEDDQREDAPKTEGQHEQTDAESRESREDDRPDGPADERRDDVRDNARPEEEEGRTEDTKEDMPSEADERPEGDPESSTERTPESEPAAGNSGDETLAADEKPEGRDEDDKWDESKAADLAVDEEAHAQSETEPPPEEASPEDGEPSAAAESDAGQEFDEKQLAVDEPQGPEAELEQSTDVIEEPALTGDSQTMQEMLLGVDEPGAEMVDAAELDEQLRIDLSVLNDGKDDEEEESTSDWQTE
jgi:hypothetical protein